MNKEQLEGKMTQIKGDAKIWVGQLTNNQKMKFEGSTDKIKGGLQEQSGDFKAKFEEELKKFEAAKDAFETRTEEVNTDIKKKWDKLTHDDVESINGSFESFSNLIKEKYNKSKDEADKDVKEFMSKFK